MKNINKAAYLTFITVGLSLSQSYLNHIGTSCYAHNYFSEYFYIELAVFILTIITKLNNKWSSIFYFLFFFIEVTWFLIKEKPYGPDELIMILIGLIRIYILVWLIKAYRIIQK